MAPGDPTTSNSDVRQKRRRKVLTLHEKMTILKKIEQGRKYSSLAREYNCNESSIRTIKKCENKIKTSITMLANSTTAKSTFLSRRDTIMEQMEHFLNVWIDEQADKNAPLTSTMIRNEARSIYDHLKSQKSLISTVESSFCASKGWFDKFKRRANLQSITMVSEGGSLDADGGESYKRTTCWAKIPLDDDRDAEDKTEIEKIINLSNMIEKEKFSDTEQSESLDPVMSELKEPKVEIVEDDTLGTEIFGELDAHDQDTEVEIASEDISEILEAAEFLKEKILMGDPDIERSAKIRREIEILMKAYADARESEEKPDEVANSIRISVPSPDTFSS